MTKSLEKNTKAVDDNNFQQIIAPSRYFFCKFLSQIFSKFVYLLEVILLAQVFGLFPICGVFAKNVKNVTFKWTNFRSIYAVLWIICGIFISYFELLRLYRAGVINAKKLSKYIFVIISYLISVL